MNDLNEEYFSPDSVYELLASPEYARKLPPKTQEISLDIFDGAEYSLEHNIPMMAVLFEALGGPTRLEILALLKEFSTTAGHIALVLERRPSTLTHHLQVLKRAGLVTVARRSEGGHYALTPRCRRLLDGLEEMLKGARKLP